MMSIEKTVSKIEIEKVLDPFCWTQPQSIPDPFQKISSLNIYDCIFFFMNDHEYKFRWSDALL